MNETSWSRSSSLAPTDARQLEQLYSRFEAAWQTGPRPVIEAYLHDAGGPALPMLLRELLRLDLAYRRRAKETPVAADYLARFPEHARLIEAVFQDSDAVSRGPETPCMTEIDDTNDNDSRGRADPAVSTEGPGTVIGPYKLVQQLGEGGMGAVWLAEQEQPVKRRVALKLIKAGMDSRQVIARFQQERQALALMDHPHIAKVLDAGTTASGRPYFVMELVQGIPITKYCDEEQLAPRERLELFIQVCQAVQHAHQKGIIHRDLKPSNVLVTLHDGKPAPIIIDFGLAKATAADLRGRTVFTEIGQVLGTPSYMAPEQAELNNPDIDTRADIYSLGVLLYELLTGATPFSVQQLREVSFMEMLRLLREVEPPRPSTKLSSSEQLPGVATRRKLDPRRLIGMVRGDLDWIVMKCLEKDRGRRYQTANALALDLQRYLADEPVLAGPPGTGYRLRKFLRRHRGPVAAAALVLLALLAGMVGTTWGLVEARRQRDAAEEARKDEAAQHYLADEQRQQAVEQKNRAEAAETLAKEEAAVAKAVNDFLRKDLLGQADVANQAAGEGDRNPNITVRELLDRTAKSLDGKFPGQPLVEAAIRQTVGNAYAALPRYAEALPHLERSVKLRTDLLGANHPDTLTSKHNLAELYRLWGKFGQAETLHREALEGRTARLGPDHPDTLQSKNDLAVVYWYQRKYDQAEPLLQEVHDSRLRTLGPGHVDTLESKNNLAQICQIRGKDDQAETLFKEALAGYTAQRGPDHPDTLTTKNNLADFYKRRRQFDLAETLFREAIQTQTAALGPNHADTLRSKQNLAGLLKNLRKYAEAETLFQEVLAGRTTTLGPNHTDTLNTKNSLAELFRLWRKYDQAEPLYRQALEGWAAQLEPDHPNVLIAKNNLAQLYLDQQQYEKAEPLFQEAVEVARRKYGLRQKFTRDFFHGLADCREKRGQPAGAESLRRELADFWKQQAPDSTPYADQLALLGWNLLQQQKSADAEPLLRTSLAIWEKGEPDAWPTFSVRSLLGGALLGLRQYAEAEKLLLQGYEGLKQRQAKMSADEQIRLTEALERLVQLYEATGSKDKADEWRKKLEETKLTQQPPTRP